MNFKEYYHNKINEDAEMAQMQQQPIDTDAVRQAPVTAEQLVKNYISNEGSLKVALSSLAKDLGSAIFEYATKEFVSAEDFLSEDDFIRYTNDIRDTVQEKYNVTLVELLRNIGIFVDNKKNTATK